MMIRKVSSLNKSYIQEYFPLMLFIMLYKVLVTFESQKHSGSPGGGYSHLQAVWVCAAVKGVAFTSFALSSAEAPVSEHQRKKREREKTGARGTMGRGKRL